MGSIGGRMGAIGAIPRPSGAVRAIPGPMAPGDVFTGQGCTCCYSSANCNTIYTLATCYVGTNAVATSLSCTNSGFCKVSFFRYIIIIFELIFKTK